MLAVGASSPAGQSNLTYTWSVTPPSGVTAPTFSANNNNAAQNTTATFSAAGSYTFTVTITDQYGGSVTSTVGVSVISTLAAITITPPSLLISNGGTQQFTATGKDQFGLVMSPLAFSWSTTVGGITAAGLFTAQSASGSGSVTASSGGLSASSAVQVIATTVNSIVAPAASVVGQSFLYTANYTGAGTHTATWNWGDGTKTSGTIAEANGSAPRPPLIATPSAAATRSR